MIQIRNEANFVFGLNIDAKSAREFAIELYNWSEKNRDKPLRINLHSTGGNIADAELLYESFMHLRSLGHFLTIVIHGRAASCAGWLVQAADLRVIGRLSEFLIHEVSSACDGGLTKFREELKRMEHLQKKTIGILCDRSQKTPGVVIPLTPKIVARKLRGGKDWWLTAQEAHDYGLVDRIEDTTPFREAA
ncbi:MAG: ATP-dependent Clp protease proteolytic subunit [Candidatus Melainabacteria bacterium]|nr:ATP-dependent Clp protease proteolytic subunit [Candidatus Melainabacteria bacterium]